MAVLAMAAVALLVAVAAGAPLSSHPLRAADPLLSGLTLGTDYYPETWGLDHVATDAAAMQAAGITMVRMAEFSWHEFQPTVDSAYNFSFFDATLAVLDAHGVKTVMGTPTASPPSWLYKADPSIALVDNEGRRVGSGSRQNMNHLHPRIISETRAIVSALAAHYANDSRVAGWQIDNEIHGDQDFSDITRDAWRAWLSTKFGGDVGALNSAWGTTFWGLQYDSFDEVPLPMATTDFENPGMQLAFRRFIGDVAGGYLELQAALLRAGAPMKPIAHNCMGSYSLVDYSRFGLSLDYVAFDNYPFSWWSASATPTRDWSTASEPRIYGTAFQAAIMRGAGQQRPFYVMENQIAGTGQNALYGFAFPELARLGAWQQVLNGADGVQFFRWRTSRWGVEQHWEGILNYDGNIKTSRFAMVAQLGSEFARASSTVFDTRVRSRVAIVLSPETRWSLLDTPVAQPALDPVPASAALLSAFRTHNINVDVVFVPADTGRGAPPPPDFAGYDIVLAPTLLVVPPALADSLAAFAARGGQLLLTSRSGSRTVDNAYVGTPLPGPLAVIAGVTMDEWDPSCSMGEAEIVSSAPGEGPFPFPASTPFGIICEMLEPAAGTTVLGTYGGTGHFAGRVAVTRNAVGAAGGGVVYAGAVVNDETYYDWLAARLAKDAGLAWGARLPYGIETGTRVGADNATTQFVINWNAYSTSVTLATAAGGRDVLTNATIAADGLVALGPFSVAVITAV